MINGQLGIMTLMNLKVDKMINQNLTINLSKENSNN